MKKLLGALAIAVVAAGPVVWTTTAGAGSPTSYDVTPRTGPVGTLITATGSGCTEPGYFIYMYWNGETPTQISGPFTPESDGTFTATATVPEFAVVGPAEVGVQCYNPEGGGQATQYFSFDVTEAPTTSSTTSTTAAPAPAVAADVVSATPAFTG